MKIQIGQQYVTQSNDVLEIVGEEQVIGGVTYKWRGCFLLARSDYVTKEAVQNQIKYFWTSAGKHLLTSQPHPLDISREHDGSFAESYSLPRSAVDI